MKVTLKMDLLASYDDDGENSQTPDNRQSGDFISGTSDGEKVQVPTGVAKPPPNLETEWENFEKLLGSSSFENQEENETQNCTATSQEAILVEKDDEKERLSRSRSRSHSRSNSRSNSSGSSDSSRSSSADSVKEIKEKKKSYSSSSSDEEEPKVVVQKTGPKKEKESTFTRSPPIQQKKRSPTPIEAPRSRSRSKSVERRKSSDKSRRSKSRSRSRDRHSHSRRRRRSRSRSRNREKHRRHGSRSKRHRRSRSRDRRRHARRRRSRSRDNHKSRSRSRDRRRRRRKHYRSRSRSRDRGHRRSPHRDSARHRDDPPGGFRGADVTKPTFKEKMRQQLLKASKMLTQQAQAGQLPPDGEKPSESTKEKPSALPLNTKTVFQAVSNASTTVTPQMALLQTMAVMHQKAQEMTGIAVPKYYNPAAVNPLKYAEQVQKRKLLWSKSKDKKEDTQAVWEGSSFNSDQDGKVAAKFRKLMGMKEGEEGDPERCEGHDGEKTDINRKQQELFQRLDREYEFARMTTHTHRGIGLGFQSQGMPDT